MAKVTINCNFFKPEDDFTLQGIDQVTEEEIISQDKEDCPNPEFSSLDKIESQYLEVITNRLIPPELQAQYPQFKQFVWDTFVFDRKHGIYNILNKFPDLINAKTTLKELLPKFVIQYMANLPQELLPTSPCELRKNVDIFSNFLPGTTAAIQQLLSLIGIKFTKEIHLTSHKVLVILSEQANKLTPETIEMQKQNEDTISMLNEYKSEVERSYFDPDELITKNYYYYDPLEPIDYKRNNPLWYIDGSELVGGDFFLNEYGEKIYFDTENLAMDFNDFINKAIEITAQLPVEYWLDLVQDYGYFGDKFILGKFILSLFGEIEQVGDIYSPCLGRKIEMNGEIFYDWNFNRLAKNWIVNGFWDYENREWNETDLQKEPFDRNKTRRAYSSDENGKKIDNEYIEEIDTHLFKWGRNEKNTWKLSNNAIGTFVKNEKTGQVYLTGKQPAYSKEETLINQVIELYLSSFYNFHFALHSLKNTIKLSQMEINYSSNWFNLDTDYWRNFKEINNLLFEDYLDLIKSDTINDLLLDGNWNLAEVYGFYIIGKFLWKKFIEFNYEMNLDLSKFSNFQKLIVDKSRNLLSDPAPAYPQFLINKDSEKKLSTTRRIYNDQNGMFLILSLRKL